MGPIAAWAKDDCAQDSKWKKRAGTLQIKLKIGYSYKLYTVVEIGSGQPIKKSAQSGQTNTIATGISLQAGMSTFTVRARPKSWRDSFGEEVAAFDMEVSATDGGKLRAKCRVNQNNPEMSCDRDYNENKNLWTIVYSLS